MSDSAALSRRQMLLGTAVAGAAAATAEVADTAGSPAAGPADPREVVLKDTPHTRTYYALARD